MQEMYLDILLLNLHRRYLDYEPRFGGFLGIFLLSAFLRKEGYEAKGFSGTLTRGLKHLDELCKEEKVSIVGLYCDYENVTENIMICRHIKEKYHIPVIVGGPQSTALKEEFFKESGVDVIIRYEGELTLLELMNFYLEDIGNLSEILGIAYIDNECLQINADRPLITNLDKLPRINEDCYLEPESFYRGLSIMTGRGCPFSCAFCHEGTHTRTVRFRSVESVLSEIDDYLEKNDSDKIYILFTDDTLTLQPKRLHALCLGLAERQKKRKFRWFCEGHVHTIYQRPEMVKDLAMAGCTRIQLGIEAGTEKVLSAYNKHCTPKEIFTVVQLCRDAGIPQIYGNIILAGAYFSKKIYEEDRIFAEKLIRESQGTLEIGVVSFWPLPETPMTLHPEKYGIKIQDKEFVTSIGDFPQAQTNKLSRLEIAKMQFDFEKMIDDLMIDMLDKWEVPTERVLSWFAGANFREGRGLWYMHLAKVERLYTYYEMLYLGEGKQSSQVDNIEDAHPLRTQPLYRYTSLDEGYAFEIAGVKFRNEDMEIMTLTTGKLSVKEIVLYTGETFEKVMEILNRLERCHFIVYTI